VIQLIVAIFAIGLCVAIAQNTWKYGLKLAGIVAAGALAVVAGIPALLGIFAEKTLDQRGLRRSAARWLTWGIWFFCLAAIIGGIPHIRGGQFEAYKYCVPAVLFVAMLVQRGKRVKDQALSEPIPLFDEKDRQFFKFYFGCFFMTVAAVCTETTYFWNDWPVSWIYVALCSMAQGWIVWQEVAQQNYLRQIHFKMESLDILNASEYVRALKAANDLDEEDIDSIYLGILVKFLTSGDLVEIQLNGCNWIFNSNWHRSQTERLDNTLRRDFRHHVDNTRKLLESTLNIPAFTCDTYMESHLDFGEIFEFPDGKHFVHYAHASNVRRCVSCGASFEKSDGAGSNGEWCCSDTCRQTEKDCENIRDAAREQFLAKAAASGFVVMEGAAAWRSGHKIFADGSKTGHGFAAERANNIADRLRGENASVLGDNNAANGPDRVVKGREIQSKYCATGARSVGHMFDNGTGKSGNYKYFDKNGRPMPVEVPKDQYAKAVETMENKIREGKIPGLENLDENQCHEEAKKLVIKGSVTYQQAVNITKFCTIESLTYDALEGAVIGSGAAGISFTITALVFYLNTKDVNAALRAGVVQAGKTFLKSATVYVIVQQSHRLAGVQRLVGLVDAKTFSPSMREFLAKGFGTSETGVSRALHGTIVTSVVVITVSTGPDLLKLVRGRVSQGQFLKNLTVTTAGVGGGVAGAVVGGAVGSSAGPVGTVLGQFFGGMLGGVVAAKVSKTIADSMIEEDRIKIMEVIYIQIEHWAKMFMLTAEELENLSANLAKAITQSLIEKIHGASNRRAAANAVVKPIVISIVKQRPTISYDMDDVIDACAEMAA